jgi:hypothetical protein
MKPYGAVSREVTIILASTSPVLQLIRHVSVEASLMSLLVAEDVPVDCQSPAGAFAGLLPLLIGEAGT